MWKTPKSVYKNLFPAGERIGLDRARTQPITRFRAVLWIDVYLSSAGGSSFRPSLPVIELRCFSSDFTAFSHSLNLRADRLQADEFGTQSQCSVLRGLDMGGGTHSGSRDF